MRQFESRPHMFTNINSSSPLKHDWPMLDGAMRAARRGQAVVDHLAFHACRGDGTGDDCQARSRSRMPRGWPLIALLQQVRDGAHQCVYGAFTSNVDMKTRRAGLSARPNMCSAMQMSGQMARRYGLPLRASNANACQCARCAGDLGIAVLASGQPVPAMPM